ncbi:hypothetical protein ASD19_11790 [Microbacterium sp. Root53]|jgi:hypothetical protein|nr:hypothetical protein ASD19_11790 [Microbacterium sp. Root53]
MATCDQCRKRFPGPGRKTATRTLCDDCFASFSGLAAGYMAGGTVEQAIATEGWFTRSIGRGRRR